jgi:hypothetical protein
MKASLGQLASSFSYLFAFVFVVTWLGSRSPIEALIVAGASAAGALAFVIVFMLLIGLGEFITGRH